MRRRIQMVFQDPLAAFNPRATVGGALADPLRIHGIADRASGRRRSRVFSNALAWIPRWPAAPSTRFPAASANAWRSPARSRRTRPDRARRGGLGARRFGARQDPRAAGRPAARTGHRLYLRLARPRRGARRSRITSQSWMPAVSSRTARPATSSPIRSQRPAARWSPPCRVSLFSVGRLMPDNDWSQCSTFPPIRPTAMPGSPTGSAGFCAPERHAAGPGRGDHRARGGGDEHRSRRSMRSTSSPAPTGSGSANG